MKKENCTILNYGCESENSSLTIYELFPGVAMSFNKVKSEYLPVFSKTLINNQSDSYLFINYCIGGRCELVLTDNTFVYQKKGDFSLSDMNTQDKYTFPQKKYEGIQFFINTKEIEDNSAFLKENFNIDFKMIAENLLVDNPIFISGCPSALEDVFLKLWEYNNECDNLFDIRLYAIEIFNYLGHASFPVSIYQHLTATQTAIAKKVHEIITEDISEHFSAKELAEKFSISESSLKNYFKGVYGQNISFFLRDLRLYTAADTLIKTKLSVNVIAGKVGYSNQSKFSAVFKERFYVTPLEFRKQKALEILR